MRKALLLSVFLGLSSSTALGASACACFPFVRIGWDIQDQEKARSRAANVVVARIDSVTTPPAPTTIGDCRAFAVVAQVERGRRYSSGDRLQFEVPCVERPWPGEFVSRGRAWVPWPELQPGRDARLYLGRGGKARDFEALPAIPG